MAGKPLQFRFNTREFDAGVRKALLQHPQQAARAMRDIKNLLVMEVKKRTPVREGHLTGSITGEAVQLERSWAATVFVPVNSPAAAYAVWLHEGDYNLGENSLAKQGKTGCAVGPKYITRAIEENRERIVGIMREALKK